MTHEEARAKDKYYTNRDVAKRLVEVVDSFYNLDQFSAIIEPSAGAGAFLDFLPPAKTIALDLYPEHSLVSEQDFLLFKPHPSIANNALCIGNPPFGKSCSLAIKFFNHSATFANTIAFILPLTFLKESVQRKLHRCFHLVYEEVLSPNSFTVESAAYDVRTCFQVWTRTPFARIYNDYTQFLSDHITFVNNPEEATIAMRRVGSRAGMIFEHDLDQLNKNTHYFIKTINAESKSILKKLNFDTVKRNTVAAYSISKEEIGKAWRKHQES